jgi:hypothetical protein
MLANEIKEELVKMTEHLKERRLTGKDIDSMLQSEFDMGPRKALKTRGDLLELGVLTRERVGKKRMSYEVVL